MTNSEIQHCASCGEMLSRNGVCAACALGDVLLGDGSALEDSWLGEPETPQFRVPTQLVLPARFGEYELRKEIASGGMGVVYEAWQGKARRTVALKMVRGHMLAGATELARFRVEAEAAAQLNHPNIVPIFEIGECEGQPFHTMRLVEGGSLAQRLKEPKPLSAREAVQLIAKVARAVHHAHQRGVLHRDLKPGNILLDKNGEPFLTDFGLARILDSESGLTLSSAHLGTPQYMSPEQAAGRTREVSTGSDVWGLGVILFQLLTGRLPFSGSNGAEILRRILEEEPASTMDSKSRSGATRHASIDRDLRTILARCLEKDSARRMSSAEVLAEELELWLGGEPIRLRPVTGLERMIKLCRKHPGKAATVGLLALSILTGSITSLTLWQQAEEARKLANAKAEEARRTRDAAEEDAYFATIANAMSERSRFDFGAARIMLGSIPPERRGFEWKLANGLCQGDELRAVRFAGTVPKCLTRHRDGRVIVLTEDRGLHVLDVEAGTTKLLGKLPETQQEVQVQQRSPGLRQIAYSPDGHIFFIVDGVGLHTFDAADIKRRGSVARTGINACWLDGNRILIGLDARYSPGVNADGSIQSSLSILDTSKRELRNLPACSQGGPFAVSPDGLRVAMTNSSKGVEIHSVAGDFAGEPLVRFSRNNLSHITSLAFSRDGTHIACAWTGGEESWAFVYDSLTGIEISGEPTSRVPRITFSPDPNRLLIATREAWIVTRDWSQPLRAGSVFDDGNIGPGDPYDATRPFRAPSKLFTRSASSGGIGGHFGHERAPGDIMSLHDLEIFLTCSDDGTVRIWQEGWRAHDQRQNMVSTEYQWRHPVLSRDGSQVLFLGDDGLTRLWVRNGSRNLLTFPEGERGLAVLNDGSFLTRHGPRQEITCWRAVEGQLEKVWHAPGGASIQGFHEISHTDMTPDGRRLAVLLPGTFLVFDLMSRQICDVPDQRMEFGSTPGQWIAISPDGKWVAVTGFAGGGVRLFNAENPGREGESLAFEDQPETHDSACVFSRDGLRLYVANCDGYVRVFDLSMRRELAQEKWLAHTSEVTAMALSGKGDILATSGTGTTVFWSAQAGAEGERRERLRVHTGRARNWMMFAGEDAAFVHSAPNEPIEFWHVAD